MKLARLKPRVALATTTRTAPIVADRLRGRRKVERDRQYLREHPLCAACHEQPAIEVDHRTPLHLGGVDGEPNLQGLCRDCHAAKTRAEQAARGGR